jgi:hypothetical protein
MPAAALRRLPLSLCCAQPVSVIFLVATAAVCFLFMNNERVPNQKSGCEIKQINHQQSANRRLRRSLLVVLPGSRIRRQLFAFLIPLESARASYWGEFDRAAMAPLASE